MTHQLAFVNPAAAKHSSTVAVEVVGLPTAVNAWAKYDNEGTSPVLLEWEENP